MMPRLLPALLLSLFAIAPAAPAAAPAPLNVLFIITDDHTPTALSCAGDPVVKTPAIDGIAAEGVLFRYAFTPYPMGGPSRGAILTGRDPWSSGITSNGRPFPPGAPLWPRLLADAGYETFYTGKWQSEGTPAAHGFTRSANVYLTGPLIHQGVHIIQHGEERRQAAPAEGYSSEVFAEGALEFLNTRRRDRPFLLYLAFSAMHDPWDPPAPFDALYDPAELPLPPNFMPEPPFAFDRETFPNLRDQRQLPFPRAGSDVREALARYYGQVSHVDAQVGRVLRRLEELGLANDTLIVFTAAQGYSLGSHGFVGKQTMYEEGIRVPLIIRHPRLRRAGPVAGGLVMHMDLFPTICLAAGIEPPGNLEGLSLLTAYQSGAAHREAVFPFFHSPQSHGMATRSIRTATHKLIAHLLTGEEELYDLGADPNERHNRIADPAYTGILTDLRQRLAARRAATEGP